MELLLLRHTINYITYYLFSVEVSKQTLVSAVNVYFYPAKRKQLATFFIYREAGKLSIFLIRIAICNICTYILIQKAKNVYFSGCTFCRVVNHIRNKKSLVVVLFNIVLTKKDFPFFSLEFYFCFEFFFCIIYFLSNHTF